MIIGEKRSPVKKSSGWGFVLGGPSASHLPPPVSSHPTLLFEFVACLPETPNHYSMLSVRVRLCQRSLPIGAVAEFGVERWQHQLNTTIQSIETNPPTFELIMSPSVRNLFFRPLQTFFCRGFLHKPQTTLSTRAHFVHTIHVS